MKTKHKILLTIMFTWIFSIIGGMVIQMAASKFGYDKLHDIVFAIFEWSFFSGIICGFITFITCIWSEKVSKFLFE